MLQSQSQSEESQTAATAAACVTDVADDAPHVNAEILEGSSLASTPTTSSAEVSESLPIGALPEVEVTAEIHTEIHTEVKEEVKEKVEKMKEEKKEKVKDAL